jgi:hypothetical protein
MATRLYFTGDTTGLPAGTLPAGEQSAQTPSWTAALGNTNQRMQLRPWGAQGNNAGTSLASTAAQNALLGMFISPPLRTVTAVGGGSMILLAAEAQGNGAANFWVNGLEIYVWRPSTGAKVGTVKAYAAASLGGTEPTSANVEQTTYITGITSTAVTPQIGDVIVCEIWSRHTQGNATARFCTFYYAGTTTYSAENTATSDCASFIEFAENLTFGSLLPVTPNYAMRQLLVR